MDRMLKINKLPFYQYQCQGVHTSNFIDYYREYNLI